MTPIRKNLNEPRRQQHSKPDWRGSKLLLHTIQLSLLLMMASSLAFAQAAAEYGSATSGMAGSMSGINLMNKVKFPETKSTSGNGSTVIMSQPSANSKNNPNYIWDSMPKGSVTANRKALEQRAGKDAAKLMLRSSPTNAFVKINGKPVGKTPILLVVPPGQYDVSMDGKRMDHAEQKIDLLPKETREFSLPLKQLYPTAVTVQLH